MQSVGVQVAESAADEDENLLGLLDEMGDPRFVYPASTLEPGAMGLGEELDRMGGGLPEGVLGFFDRREVRGDEIGPGRRQGNHRFRAPMTDVGVGARVGEGFADQLDQHGSAVRSDVGDVHRADASVGGDRIPAYAAALGQRGPRRSFLPFGNDDPRDSSGLAEDALRIFADLLATDVSHREPDRSPDPGRRSRYAPETPGLHGQVERMAHGPVHEESGDYRARRRVEGEQVERRIDTGFDRGT